MKLQVQTIEPKTIWKGLINNENITEVPDYATKGMLNNNKYYTQDCDAKRFVRLFIDYLVKEGVNIEKVKFIEPSAGGGVFMKYLPKNKLGLDVEPEAEGIIKQDFLTYKPDGDNIVFIGNPPFGRAGMLARAFIERCFLFSKYVGFILPPTCYNNHNIPTINSKIVELHNLENNCFTMNNKIIDYVKAKFCILNRDQISKIETYYTSKYVNIKRLKTYKHYDEASFIDNTNIYDGFLVLTAFYKDNRRLVDSNIDDCNQYMVDNCLIEILFVQVLDASKREQIKRVLQSKGVVTHTNGVVNQITITSIYKELYKVGLAEKH